MSTDRIEVTLDAGVLRVERNYVDVVDDFESTARYLISEPRYYLDNQPITKEQAQAEISQQFGGDMHALERWETDGGASDLQSFQISYSRR